MKAQTQLSSLKNPHSTLQEALYDLDVNDVVKTIQQGFIRIYMFKGTHHFINCQDYQDVDLYDIDLSADSLAILCFDFGF